MGRHGKSSTGPHKHCETCYNHHCKVPVEISTSCVVISCRLLCGATFHLCKEDEHRLLCPREMVPCLSAHYGCPMSMPRHRLAQHLEVCPASVVSCSLEWNRWPIPETDTAFYENALSEPNYMNQLDVAMALRDQKLLFSSIKMSRLFPELMERLEGPAVQETDGASGDVGPNAWKAGDLSRDETLDVSDGQEVQELTREEIMALARTKDLACLENYVMWEGMFKKEMEGCKQTVKNLQDNTGPKKKEGQSTAGYGEAVQSPQEVQKSKNVAAVDLAKTGFAPWQDGVLERLRQEVHVSEYNMYLVHNGCMLINFGQLAACTPKEKDFVYGSLEPIKVETIRSFNIPKSFTAKRNHLKDPSQRAKRTDQNVDTSDLGVSIQELPRSDEVQTTLLCCLERELKGHQICETVATDGLYVDQGTQTYDFPSAPFRPDTLLIDITDRSPPRLCVQVQTESVTRRHNKSSSTFTYLCSHTFRRDEYPWHFRNVHADIQSCLTGWFIQRCPLAYLGCTYNQCHFRPSVNQAVVSYSQDLSAFTLRPQVAASLYKGVRTGNSERKHPRNLDQLSRLPFEILQHIAGFLDSVSLCHLSQVSQLMREVCETLLQKRGMVSLKWEKKTYSHGGTCWRARKKVWEFSSLFSPVDKWIFKEMPPMAEHLKVCPYYQCERRSEPVALVSTRDATGMVERGRILYCPGQGHEG
ncbi:F-box only protein 40 isoform X2 [Electrophorus electricus]|uniref:F-box only protein 40 isoform X2 n=1 Tax=Electrophorus electricus TaxID=8005 RepID=UPI0015D0D073|nr:F-box only protein 40 isoform X2 [Electrophorus electricus]